MDIYPGSTILPSRISLVSGNPVARAPAENNPAQPINTNLSVRRSVAAAFVAARSGNCSVGDDGHKLPRPLRLTTTMGSSRVYSGGTEGVGHTLHAMVSIDCV